MRASVFRASLLTLCCILAAAGASRSASAQEADAAERLEASLRESHRTLAELGDGPDHRWRAGVVLNDIGHDQLALGRTDSALVYFRRALAVRREVGDRQGEGNTLQNLGATLSQQGRADTALVVLREALDAYHETGDRPGHASVLVTIGLSHQRLSRADSALVSLRSALAAARELGEDATAARAMEGLGSVFLALAVQDSASFYVASARETNRRIGNRPAEVGTIVAGVPLGRGESPAARLVELHEMLAEVRALPDRPREGTLLVEIGSAHHDAGGPDSALVYYGLARAVQRGLGDRQSEGATLVRIAQLHAREAHRDSALTYYARALPLLRDAGDRREAAAALGDMGVLHHLAGTPDGLAHATAYYDSADAVLAELARSSGGDQGWLSFVEVHASLYDSWAVAWLDREPRVASDAVYAALAAAERGRAQALREMMRRHPDPEVDARAGPAHPGPGADLVAEGRELVSAVRRGGVPVISYLVSRGMLFTFLIRPEGEVEVFRTELGAAEIAATVTDLRTGLAPAPAGSPGGALWRAPAAFLAEVLLPVRLRERLPASGELAIVPSGPLFLVPFAALPLTDGAHADSFLGLRFAIRYAPSLQVLASLAVPPRYTNPGAEALVVGNPAMPRVPTSDGGTFRLSPLPNASEEAGWVAARMGAPLLTGEAASEAAVREHLATATLVHLATHGRAFATASHMRDSYIALAEGDGADGLLTVGEVLDHVPPMRAELVVLSACETGLGGLTRSEGTVGLQRAFLASGARGVLVSLWSVGDASAAELMRLFYDRWLSGTPRAEALRWAQATLASRPEYAHPRHWAAFQLVGSP